MMNDRPVMLSPYFDSTDGLAEMMQFLNLYADEGFRHLEYMAFKRRHLDGVVDFFKSHNATITYIKKETNMQVELVFEGSKIVLMLREHTHYKSKMVLLLTTNGDRSLLLKFLNLIPSDGVDTESVLDLAYYYLSSKYGLTSANLSVNVDDFANIYPELYPDIDIKNLVLSYSKANEPILMLYGEPGVGKTTFIKYILAEGNFSNAAYIKDPRVMEDGELWGMLTGGELDLVIFDDLDVSLLPRQKNSDSAFMSQLLSFSDGIFTQGKVKIIITTNQTVKEIDSALVRPGRCFDFLKLNPLSSEEAGDFWINGLKFDAESFKRTFGDDEIITQATLMSEATRMGASIGERPYIKKGDNRYTLDRKLGQLGIKAATGEEKGAGFFNKN